MKLSHALIISLFSSSLLGSPLGFSEWKLSKDSPASIIILHDNHGFDQHNPDTATQHFECLKNVLAVRKDPLRVLIECPSQDPKLGRLILQQTCVAPNYTKILLHQYLNLFQEYKNSHLIKISNIESRNVPSLITAHIGLKSFELMPDFEDFRNASAIKKFRTDIYEVLSDTTFNDILTPPQRSLQHLIATAPTESYRSLFKKIYATIVSQIDDFKKILQEHNIDLEQKPLHMMNEKTSEEKIIIAGHRIDWENFLLEMIEAEILRHLMASNNSTSMLVIAGFEHTRNLESMLPSIGYFCCKKISFRSPKEFPLSLYQNIANDGLRCNTCNKHHANMICSVCKKIRYCDRTCQRKDWEAHKKLCARTEQKSASTKL